MNCHEALEALYEYLDDELTPDRTKAVRAHLDACAHCFAMSRFEDAFLKFLEARSRGRDAPPHLKKRILEQLLTEPDDTVET